MKYKLTVMFSSEESRDIVIKILNKVKKDNNLLPLDLGSLATAMQDAEEIKED